MFLSALLDSYWEVDNISIPLSFVPKCFSNKGNLKIVQLK